LDIELVIENSRKDDLQDIIDIYNWAIENTSATFDTEVKTIESQLGWYESHCEDYPIFVMRNNSKVIAWGSISRWSDRCAYSGTGEISFYVHPDFHGSGVGTMVLKKLIEVGKETKFRTLVSRIAGKSDASIHLHKKLGFSDIGTMKNVGKKFGEIVDVHLMQILF
jgi:L-amino acid N-acyltransferase YncA